MASKGEVEVAVFERCEGLPCRVTEAGEARTCDKCGGGVVRRVVTLDAEAVREVCRPLEAAMREAIAILDSGTDYERLHVSGILSAALAPSPTLPEAKNGMD